jgi:predicted O-methyltransferase YrrM
MTLPTTTKECLDYFTALSAKESAELIALRETAKTLDIPPMHIQPLQGRLLAFLTQLIGAKTILEIGTYVGYSTLWLAGALPDDGKIITCDIKEHWTKHAPDAWKKAGQQHKIELILQPALDTMAQLSEKQQTFDIIFIDADKANYLAYYEASLSLVASKGLILIDNVWWHGEVVDESNQRNRTKIMRKLNQTIADDPRVKSVMLPIGDGLTLLQKN